jgi:hypothetical protein
LIGWTRRKARQALELRPFFRETVRNRKPKRMEASLRASKRVWDFAFSFFIFHFLQNRPRRTELELAVLSLFAKLFWVKSENSVDRCVVLENFGKLLSRFQASMSSYTDGDL